MLWKSIAIAGYILSWSMVPVILRANKAPVSTLNWIWVCIFIPWFGPLAYLLLGNTRLARKHLRKQEELDSAPRAHEHRAEILPPVAALIQTLDERERKIIDVLSDLNLAAVSAASEVDVLIDAQTFYPALIDAIGLARHHAHIEFYIFRPDKYGVEFVQALAAAAKRGVQVRLLVDSVGGMGTKDDFFRPLVEAGGKFAWFRTVSPLHNRWIFNLRNHRKIQVIDGEWAFVGGMNVGLEYMGEKPEYGSWRDVQIKLHGQVATAIQRFFADDWFYATDEKLIDDAYYPISALPAKCTAQVVADGPDVDADPIQMSIVALLNDARETAWLTAGYFVPNEPLITALKLCASRGVDTRLLISAKSEHPYLVQVGRSYYEDLLDYGVRLFEYEKGINHAKVAAFDHRWMMIGSANFDNRSMQLNFELNVLVDDPENAVKLEETLRHDYEQESQEINLEQFRQRSYKQRCIESLFRPLAPLL